MADPDIYTACGCLKADGDDGVFLSIYVQPRASKNSFVGIHGSALKLRITAPPVEGKANGLVLKLLAKLFKVPKSSVDLVGGQQSRTKRFRVSGVGVKEAVGLLDGLLSESK